MKTIKLVYVIGRYPELTTTFIEREIKILRELGGFEVQPVSLRYPETLETISAEHDAIRADTLYLVPKSWLRFNFFTFFIANLYFACLRLPTYFTTLIYLFIHSHPDLKTRLLTIFHFGLGVYLAYLLRHRDFDHLHAHFIDRSVVLTLVVGRLLNKTYSLTAHANSIFVKRILIREKITNAKFMVTVSQHNKAHLLNTYPGLDADKIHVLHPWVDVSHVIPPIARPVHQRLNIISVGRLVEKKGHSYLVEACHLLQEQGLAFECRFVGDGPLRTYLERQIEHYNLQNYVHIMGGQPQCKVQQLLASWADVFVLPCVIAKDGDRDGIPVALAEAMAMELPVISTNIVGISELVQPHTGFLVPPRNPTALAEAIKSVCATDSDARAEMGHQGRAIVSAEFDLVKGTTQLAHLFRQVVLGDQKILEL